MTSTIATGLANPFPGLRPFGSGDRHLFFGREAVADELLERLRSHRFVAVLGAAGIGKSSLVRARMLPALHATGGAWRTAVMHPADAPLANLAYALMHPRVLGSEYGNRELKAWIAREVLERGPHGLVELVEQTRLAAGDKMLVVVDQFEELFRYAHSGSDAALRDDAAAFVRLLLKAVSQTEHSISVVLVIGADFLEKCVRFRDLPEAINRSHVLAPGLTRDALQRAIEEPARAGGATYAPALVKRLLDGLRDDGGELPALQHALMRTWHFWHAEQRAADPVDVRHLEAAGGLANALWRHLDEIYAALPDDRSKEIATKLFKAVTATAPGDVTVRRPVRFADVWATIGCTSDELRRVVEPFSAPGRSFLRPSPHALDESSVLDLSYERLVRA